MCRLVCNVSFALKITAFCVIINWMAKFIKIDTDSVCITWKSFVSLLDPLQIIQDIKNATIHASSGRGKKKTVTSSYTIRFALPNIWSNIDSDETDRVRV